MRGHFLSGTRKLNRHYQSTDALRPWLVINDTGLQGAGNNWIDMTVNNKRFKLNNVVIGISPEVIPVESMAVPFQIQIQKRNVDPWQGYTLGTKNILQSIPFDGGEIPIYDINKDYEEVGTVTITRTKSSEWKLTSNFPLVLTFIKFDITYHIDTATDIKTYIGYKKEYNENE